MACYDRVAASRAAAMLAAALRAAALWAAALWAGKDGFEGRFAIQVQVIEGKKSG